jgi:hypothetical protein
MSKRAPSVHASFRDGPLHSALPEFSDFGCPRRQPPTAGNKYPPAVIIASGLPLRGAPE